MIDDFKQTIDKLKQKLSTSSEIDDSIQKFIEYRLYNKYNNTHHKSIVTKLKNIVNSTFRTKSKHYFNKLKKIIKNLSKERLEIADTQLDNLLSELKFSFFTGFVYHYFDNYSFINDYTYNYLTTDFIKLSKQTHDIDPLEFIKTLENIKNYNSNFCKQEFLKTIQSIINQDNKQYILCLENLSKLISHKKNQLDELLISSANCKSVKNYDKSAICLEKILETDYKNPNIFYKLSEDYLNLNNYEKSQQNLLKVISLIESKETLTKEQKHQLIDSYNRLGFSYIKQAKDFYKEEKHEYFEGYGDNLFRAIEVLNNTIKKYPRNVKAYYLLVSAYLYLSDYYEKKKQLMIKNPYNIEDSLKQKRIQELEKKFNQASSKARKIIGKIFGSKGYSKTEKNNKPYFEYYPDIDSRRFLFHLNSFLDVGITLKCFDKSDSDRANLEDDILDLLREPSKYTCFRNGNRLETPKSWVLEFDDKVVLVEEYIPEQNMFRYFKYLNHRFIRKSINQRELRNLKLSELEWIVDITAQLQIYLTNRIGGYDISSDYYSKGFETRFIGQLDKYKELLLKPHDWRISEQDKQELIRLHKENINNKILSSKPPYKLDLHLLSIDANLKNFLKNKKKIDLEIKDKKIAVIDPISAIEFATGFLSQQDELYLHYRWLLNIIQNKLANSPEPTEQGGIIQDITNKLIPIKEKVIKEFDDLLADGYNINKEHESEYKAYRSKFNKIIIKYISKQDQEEYNYLINLVGIDRHLAIASDKLRDINRIKNDTNSFIEEHPDVKNFIDSILNYSNKCEGYKENIIDCWKNINLEAGKVVLDSLCKSNTISVLDFFTEISPLVGDAPHNKIVDILMQSVEIYHDYKKYQQNYRSELNRIKIKDEIREYLLRQDDIDSNYHYYLYHLKRARINMEQIGLLDFRNKLQEVYGFWDFRGDRNNNGDGTNEL